MPGLFLTHRHPLRLHRASYSPLAGNQSGLHLYRFCPRPLTLQVQRPGWRRTFDLRQGAWISRRPLHRRAAAGRRCRVHRVWRGSGCSTNDRDYPGHDRSDGRAVYGRNLRTKLRRLPANDHQAVARAHKTKFWRPLIQANPQAQATADSRASHLDYSTPTAGCQCPPASVRPPHATGCKRLNIPGDPADAPHDGEIPVWKKYPS